MDLTPDQARALWDAGGFAVLRGLPAGAETGIDGTFHTTNAFAGYKFVPPGLHVLTWSLPGTVLRSAVIRVWGARERVALSVDGEARGVSRIEEAELRALDKSLAPYPFARLEQWKGITSHVTADVVARVLPEQRIDGMTTAEGDADELGAAVKEARRQLEKEGVVPTEGGGSVPAAAASAEAKMRFPVFELRRSWKEGATGDEVTRWARDKSQLWGRVCTDVGGSGALLGTLELAFVLVTEVWSIAALGAYKRLLALWCRSAAAIATPDDFVGKENAAEAREMFLALVNTLAAQIASLPESTSDLPDLDEFYLDELSELGKNLGAALAEPPWWGLAKRTAAAWEKLTAAARARGWELPPLPAGDEDSDEEGEFAPVVVEM